MELRQYLAIVGRWLWLIVLSVVIAATSSYFASKAATPLYRAKTTLMVGRSLQNPDPNSADLYTGQQLAYTYSQLARREPVLKGTVDILGLPISWEGLANQVSTAIVPQTQLLEISVIDSDPYRAKVIADTIAQQLILQSPSGAEGTNLDQAAFSRQQLTDLKTKIEQAQKDEEQLKQELDAANSARQIQDLQNQIDVLDTKISGWQDTYSNLLLSLLGGDINALTVVEEASIPSWPISPNVKMNVLLAAVIGLVLAVGGIFVIEYLDDTFKTSEDITRALDLPVIGQLVDMGKDRNRGTYVARNPHSEIADAYRILRANVEALSANLSTPVLMVTSVGMMEGKTSVAINLAVILSQAGRKVVLIDGDMRKPHVHVYLGLQAEIGLGEVLQKQASLEEVITFWQEGKISVIPAGQPPLNPAELLSSIRFRDLLKSLGKIADFVVIDAPPTMVPDATAIASLADGVLMVVRYGYTRKKEVSIALEQLYRVGAGVIGIALNRMPRSSSTYYNHYHYYKETNDNAQNKVNGRGRLFPVQKYIDRQPDKIEQGTAVPSRLTRMKNGLSRKTDAEVLVSETGAETPQTVPADEDPVSQDHH